MKESRPNLIVAAVAAWLVPGAGHFLVLGLRKKGIFFFLLITGTFLAGLVLSGFQGVRWERHPIYFLAYGLNGLPCVATMSLTANIEVTRYIKFELLGTLYCAVACLLNLLVVLDVFASAERVENARAQEAGAS